MISFLHYFLFFFSNSEAKLALCCHIQEYFVILAISEPFCFFFLLRLRGLSRWTPFSFKNYWNFLWRMNVYANILTYNCKIVTFRSENIYISFIIRISFSYWVFKMQCFLQKILNVNSKGDTVVQGRAVLVICLSMEISITLASRHCDKLLETHWIFI